MSTNEGTAVHLRVNGEEQTARVDPRMLLVEALREDFGRTGPKIGCLTGDCGACTVRLDGDIVKSCLELAVACDGSSVDTIEGMGTNGRLSPVQEAFWDEYAFQCGYCLSGMLFAVQDLIDRIPDPSEEEVRTAISGNLCRCTGYENIVQAALAAAARTRSANRT